jgi:signal transduction histidine kinase
MTDVRKAQYELVEAQRLSAVGEAMTGLVHESRNALARSQAELRMLSRRIKDCTELQGYIDRAIAAQREVQHLFEDVRQYAAPLKLERQPCDLGELLADVWQKLEASRAGRTACLAQNSAGVDLRCDIDRFGVERVFRNILENTLTACQDPVRIETQCSEVRLNGLRSVQLSIRDNGPGLTEEQQERIFDAFYTTKTHGTGLGMAIAKRIMHAIGGDIVVGSGGGPGAEFVLTFPRARP